jgi:hypothetical protein
MYFFKEQTTISVLDLDVIFYKYLLFGDMPH